MNNIFSSINYIFLRVPLSEQVLFAKHLSIMVRAGMSEMESVRLVRRQVKSRGFKKILDRVVTDLENGRFLSASLKRFPFAFRGIFISIIQVGEVSGLLSENLEYLAEELRKAQILRSKIRAAMVYPIVILIATFGLTGAMVFFVLPKILPVFASLNIELPITTKILIASANFIFLYYPWILLGIVLFILAWGILVRIPPITYAYHRSLIALPFIGTAVVEYNMANITRTLGLLLKSGIKIVDAVNGTGDVIDNHAYKRALKESAERIQRGEALHKYLEEKSALFPQTVGRMVEVGEKTGNLDANLLYIAEFYEEAIDETTRNISSVFEPVLLLLMGGIVGFIAVSIITPIYSVTQGFHQ